MKRNLPHWVVICLALFPITASLHAQANPPSYPNQKEDNFTIKNFKFQSGETLPELKLHYTTVGTLHKNAQGEFDNAVLLLHGTTGTGKNFLSSAIGGQLFGSGQPLDATKYYLIMPDGIGRGGSSKPSDGMHAKFPHYGYLDVVEGQYRLVTEGLGIKHLKLCSARQWAECRLGSGEKNILTPWTRSCPSPASPLKSADATCYGGGW